MQLPATFIQQTREIVGDEYPLFEEALSSESPVSIRINPNKPIAATGLEQVPWCETGFYLPTRPIFTLDPLFHAGCYYVQEASSMFLEQVVKRYIQTDVNCLDLCAAPGGKSTLLSSLLPTGSLLVANEVIASRTQILAENICKWGNPATLVTQNTPEELGRIPGFFDVVFADVPCSGEGMFRKDPRSISEWSPQNVKRCVERQQQIINDIWPALKAGGLLVYSTCTYNTAENEENIEWIVKNLDAEVLPIPTPPEWNISNEVKGKYPTYRFFPHKTKGEGFFIAVLRKNGSDSSHTSSKKKQKRKTPSLGLPPQQVCHWIKDADHFHFRMQGNCVYAIPQKHVESLSRMENLVRLFIPGIRLAEIKGKDIIPQHALAMTKAFNEQAFPSCEVDRESALQYLRKEAICLPTNNDDIKTGFVVLTYQHRRLGFVKNIGNRANNLYPSEWRIRNL